MRCFQLALALLASAGCSNDVATFFEEDGAWSLVEHDVPPTGRLLPVDVGVRKDTFLLRFWADERVVQTAVCSGNPDDSPASSFCDGNIDARWHCRCFAYAFEGDAMRWVEFEAGAMPPSVSTEADAGTHIELAETELPDTFVFSPLPADVFGSNGDSSRYVFQRKTPAVFSRAFEDPERETCVPCLGE